MCQFTFLQFKRLGFSPRENCGPLNLLYLLYQEFDKPQKGLERMAILWPTSPLNFCGRAGMRRMRSCTRRFSNWPREYRISRSLRFIGINQLGGAAPGWVAGRWTSKRQIFMSSRSLWGQLVPTSTEVRGHCQIWIFCSVARLIPMQMYRGFPYNACSPAGCLIIQCTCMSFHLQGLIPFLIIILS